MDDWVQTFQNPWVIFGLGAQALFFMRFLVQWIASERAGRSVIPVAFWWFSIAGACGLLVYAIEKRDPVFIIGQSLGFIIYSRNLVLIYRERVAPTAAVATTDPEAVRPEGAPPPMPAPPIRSTLESSP